MKIIKLSLRIKMKYLIFHEKIYKVHSVLHTCNHYLHTHLVALTGYSLNVFVVLKMFNTFLFSNRKAKLIFFYEWVITLDWSGEYLFVIVSKRSVINNK